MCERHNVGSSITGIVQVLALGLSMGKDILRKINLTTFIRPWGYGLPLTMQQKCPIHRIVYLKGIAQVNIVRCQG